jgi:hypothetical protein
MTLIELLVLLVIAACCMVGVAIGATLHGGAGAALGLLIGASALPVPVILLGWLDAKLRSGPAESAPCFCGHGTADFTFEAHEHHGYVDRCSCGAAFVRRRGRVQRVDGPAGPRPYARWHAWRGWIDDPEAPQEAGGGPYR